jgi:hypothetical protein
MTLSLPSYVHAVWRSRPAVLPLPHRRQCGRAAALVSGESELVNSLLRFARAPGRPWAGTAAAIGFAHARIGT